MSWEATVAIQQLVCRERESRDRCWWDEMRSTYTPDAPIRLSWYQGDATGFVDGSIEMATKGTPSKHKLGPVVVRANEARALATVSATIEARTDVDGVEADLVSDTRLLYRVVRGQDGGWRLASLDCIYEKDRLVAAVPDEQLNVPAEELNKFRGPYRCLSFVLERRGFAVHGGLVGDDRPDDVAKLYESAFQWLEEASVQDKAH